MCVLKLFRAGFLDAWSSRTWVFILAVDLPTNFVGFMLSGELLGPRDMEVE